MTNSHWFGEAASRPFDHLFSYAAMNKTRKPSLFSGQPKEKEKVKEKEKEGEEGLEGGLCGREEEDEEKEGK